MSTIILAADPLPFKSHPRPLFCPHTPAGAQHETESQIPLSLTLKTTNGEWDGNTNSTVQDENIRKFSRFAHESPVFWTDTDALCRMISRIAPSPPL